MITLEKVRHEIKEMLEKGCMTSECVRDLGMLYLLQEKMEDSHSEMRPAPYREDSVFDLHKAKTWVGSMKNADGSTGEHWTFEQTSQVMKQRNMECSPIEFYATMNMLWSDYGKIAEKFGVSNIDYWAEMSRAFLMDRDAVHNKLAHYYECIAQK